MSTTTPIDRPIFIVGSGRSGTTLLYELLAMHRELCWFSNLSEKFPSIPAVAATHRLLDVPILGTRMKRRFSQRQFPSIRPSEAQNLYHSYCGFENARRSTVSDLNQEARSRFEKCITGHLLYTGKRRFLTKQTANTQRLDVIHGIFPDAYLVHIIRDGRAVASSLMKVPWWGNVQVWWLGQTPSQWELQGGEAIELCALHWQRELTEIREHGADFSDRYLEVRYEELVADPQEVVDEVVRFCGLSDPRGYASLLPNRLRNMNYKWRQDLTTSQMGTLEQTLGSSLAQLGYAT